MILVFLMLFFYGRISGNSLLLTKGLEYKPKSFKFTIIFCVTVLEPDPNFVHTFSKCGHIFDEEINSFLF